MAGDCPTKIRVFRVFTCLCRSRMLLNPFALLWPIVCSLQTAQANGSRSLCLLRGGEREKHTVIKQWDRATDKDNECAMCLYS